ncbi:MAG: hypothetical protein V1897_19145 [Pseudomonadota bacterium]
MGKLRDYNSALKYGNRIYPEDLASPLTFSGHYFYVDGDHGTDSDNAGTTIEKPFATIQKAIDSATAWDVIFVAAMDPDSDASDPGQYAEDLTIPYEKHGLSIIGVTPAGGTKLPYMGPKIKNATTALGNPLLHVYAAGVRLESLQFNCTRNSGTYGIWFDGITGYATIAGSVGFTMVNCMIKNGGQTGAEAYYGVTITGGYGGILSNCTFQGCLSGINLASNILPSNGHTVEYCNFKSVNNEAITVHINIPAGSAHDWNIDHCNFQDATKFIVCGASGISGVISNSMFADGNSVVAAASTGKIEIPAALDTVVVANCYDGSSALIASSGS